MATTAAPNPRASLLANLRTGGVRSASNPMANVPHTAAPGGSFNISRHVSNGYTDPVYEEEDELADMVSQSMYINQYANRLQQPMTAAVDGSANRFAQQQNLGMNNQVPMSPFMAANQSQLQALQLQMMQAEIARLQAIQMQQQQQQYQAELLAQAQRQRQVSQPQAARRGAMPPASAGPTSTSFDLRAATIRRAQQAEMSRLGVVGEDQVPMTASLGGRFGSRVPSGGFDELNPPQTPSYTTVISGGTSLGGAPGATVSQSKSDAAVSWRRGGNNNSVLSGNRTASAPVVKITPPPSDIAPSAVISPVKTRPQPLRFTAELSQPLTSVAIATNEATDGDDSSSSSSRSNSSPSTPRTASSVDVPPLSPREEASKKLYEGLGIGRPVPTVTVVAPPAALQRMASMPLRQPYGPPSHNEELMPKNFASRSRRKAIGALLDARERREVVEAF
ncbi:hypothetical protein QCA50_000298 [Cerrena zonata]|uniref:Uncharacterized protein n=1 Tax=Cerrena zonata TaxID=2478898 RepID=A0AAW0GSN1_9APHY